MYMSHGPHKPHRHTKQGIVVASQDDTRSVCVTNYVFESWTTYNAQAYEAGVLDSQGNPTHLSSLSLAHAVTPANLGGGRGGEEGWADPFLQGRGGEV